MTNSISLLVLGKRGGILQWYENILDADVHDLNCTLNGFALNHNNWRERLYKKILKLLGQPCDVATATLLNKKILSVKPDIILIADLFYFSQPILDVLSQHKSKTKIYHWIGDFFDQRLAASKEVITSYLFTDSTFIEDAARLGILNCQYFPLAFNPRLFHSDDTKTRNKELLFIGAWCESRQKLLEQIQFPIAVYGKGWDKLKAPHMQIHPHNIPLSEVASLYQNYDYVLNIINKSNTRIGLNMRCFEAPGAGATLVTEYSPDLNNCFDLEHDVIYFNNVEELTQKLKQEQKTHQIDAQHATQKTHQLHSYTARIKQLINLNDT